MSFKLLASRIRKEIHKQQKTKCMPEGAGKIEMLTIGDTVENPNSYTLYIYTNKIS